MSGLRILQVAAFCCGLVLAISVIATAAQVPGRLLIGLLQVLVVVALAAPYAAILWALRNTESPARTAWGLLLARATGWTTLVLACALLYQSSQISLRTGQPKGSAEILFATLALIPPVVALLVGARRMGAIHPTSKLSLGRAVPVALAAGASIVALPAILLWQSGWQHSWFTESTAIGDMRSMAMAQSMYAEVNEGAFGAPECLIEPRDCLPGYRGPLFLDETFLQPVKDGYMRVFYAGPSPVEGAGSKSFRSYAYVALPEEAGVTGVRGFCGDDTGNIYIIPGARLPTIVEGRCPAGEPLR